MDEPSPTPDAPKTNFSDADIPYSLNEFLKLNPEEAAEFAKRSKSDPELVERLTVSISDLLDSPNRKLKRFDYKRSQPYYKEAYGIESKAMLDYCIKEGKNVHFLYRDYPGYAPATLENRIRQSMAYVEDMMDEPDGRYKKRIRRLKVLKQSNRILVSLMENEEHIPLTKWEEARDMSSLEDVLIVVKQFAEQAPDGVKLEIPGNDMLPFDLLPEEIKQVEDLAKRFTHINCLITRDKIKLMKKGIE